MILEFFDWTYWRTGWARLYLDSLSYVGGCCWRRWEELWRWFWETLKFEIFVCFHGSLSCWILPRALIFRFIKSRSLILQVLTILIHWILGNCLIHWNHWIRMIGWLKIIHSILIFCFRQRKFHPTQHWTLSGLNTARKTVQSLTKVVIPNLVAFYDWRPLWKTSTFGHRLYVGSSAWFVIVFFSKPFLFLQLIFPAFWNDCWVDSMLWLCWDLDGIWWLAIVWNSCWFFWLIGLEFGAFTDLVGRVENVEDSSDVELDEFDEIELFGLFHPTAAENLGWFYGFLWLRVEAKRTYGRVTILSVFACKARGRNRFFIRASANQLSRNPDWKAILTIWYTGKNK